MYLPAVKNGCTECYLGHDYFDFSYASLSQLKLNFGFNSPFQGVGGQRKPNIEFKPPFQGVGGPSKLNFAIYAYVSIAYGTTTSIEGG